jgi:hypothetical protein
MEKDATGREGSSIVLEDANSKIETGNRKLENKATSFQFLVSAFRLSGQEQTVLGGQKTPGQSEKPNLEIGN